MQFVTSWTREGMHTQAQKVVLRQLRYKLGSVAPEDAALLEDYPTGRLEDLAEAPLGFESRDDLRAWLDANPPPPRTSERVSDL